MSLIQKMKQKFESKVDKTLLTKNHDKFVIVIDKLFKNKSSVTDIAQSRSDGEYASYMTNKFEGHKLGINFYQYQGSDDDGTYVLQLEFSEGAKFEESVLKTLLTDLGKLSNTFDKGFNIKILCDNYGIFAKFKSGKMDKYKATKW